MLSTKDSTHNTQQVSVVFRKTHLLKYPHEPRSLPSSCLNNIGISRIYRPLAKCRYLSGICALGNYQDISTFHVSFHKMHYLIYVQHKDMSSKNLVQYLKNYFSDYTCHLMIANLLYLLYVQGCRMSSIGIFWCAFMSS